MDNDRINIKQSAPDWVMHAIGNGDSNVGDVTPSFEDSKFIFSKIGEGYSLRFRQLPVVLRPNVEVGFYNFSGTLRIWLPAEAIFQISRNNIHGCISVIVEKPCWLVLLEKDETEKIFTVTAYSTESEISVLGRRVF